MPKKKKNKVKIHGAIMKVAGVYRVKDVLDYVGNYEKLYGIHMVKMGSHRYQTFKKKGVVCVTCGIKGKFMILESHRYGDNNGRFHFNLYGIKNKSLVLMTKDHIIPKSKGGKNNIGNYQTMCHVCNRKKGNGD